MKKTVRGLSLLLALLLALSGTALAHEFYYPGDVIPDFTVTDPDGQEYTLSKLLETHKAVLINFWFVECPWCVMEFPYIEQLYQQYGDDVAVLALTPYDSDEDVAAFRAEHGLTFPMARDDAGLSMYFNVSSYPTTIIIDRYGVYTYSESGAQPSADAFVNMCTPFIADDYAEPLVNLRIPDVLPDVEMPAPDEIAAAVGADGSALTFSEGAVFSWPWIVGSDDSRSWLVSSNAGQNDTAAELRVAFEANPGDALAFDFRISSEPLYDELSLLVNGKPVKVFSGSFDWRGYAIPFDEAGSYEVCFRYSKDVTDSAYDDEARISNLRLLSGSEAEAALAANPGIPNPLTDGSITIEPVNDSARAILFRDGDGNLLEGFSGLKMDGFYLTDADTERFRLRVHEDSDPEFALCVTSYDQSFSPIAHLEQDADGYYLTSAMDSLGATGKALTLVYASLNRSSTDAIVAVFRDAADIDAFCADLTANASGEAIESVTWEYADAQAEPTEAAPAEVEHTLLFTDADGNPLSGVTANLCSDTACAVVVSGEDGRAAFTGEPIAYDVHVLVAPEGYAADPSAAFGTNPQGGETVIVLEAAD